MEKVIFPDIEKVVVAGLVNLLASRTEPVAHNVKVATIKPAPDVSPYPSKVIVVRGDGGPKLDQVRKMERLGLTIWADTYADASGLARLVEALVTDLAGEEIKYVNVALSPVRVAEDGPQECRYLTIEVITKGTDL